MAWYEKIVTAHTAVTNQVSHGGRLKSTRYFVWQESGRTDLEADEKHAEKTVSGTTDLFTKREFDPWAAALEAQFDLAGIAWRLNSVQFEEETGFWHTEWAWTVI